MREQALLSERKDSSVLRINNVRTTTNFCLKQPKKVEAFLSLVFLYLRHKQHEMRCLAWGRLGSLRCDRRVSNPGNKFGQEYNNQQPTFLY